MSRRILVGGLAVLVVGTALAFGAWYLLIRNDAPPPVDLESAIRAAASATAASAASASASGAAASTPAPASASVGLNGVWQIASGGQSFVGYRVKEELAQVGAATAVGRTTAVTASLEFDGSRITAVTVDADFTRLQSDRAQRDNALRQQAIETNRFPSATFTLTQPIELGTAPEADRTIEATALGDLTLHGVTKSIAIPLQGRLVNGQVVVVGSLDIVFADYNIAQPRALSVLSVENHGLIELQLIFSRG